MQLCRLMLKAIAMAMIAGLACAGEIAPGLEARMQAAEPDEPIGAMIFLKDQVDVVGMDMALHLEKAPLATRHARVVTDLQDMARSTQADLLATLDELHETGRVKSYTSYWIVNCVFVVATRDVLEELAQRPDVDVIEPQLKTELVSPVGELRSASRGIGITPGVANVGARRVWNELGIRGEGAIIASLDSGVDGHHPALADRWRGTVAPASECWLDVIEGGTSFPSDGSSYGHGTHTTGTMCGLAPDDTIGVAPGALWIAANAIDQGAGAELDADIIQCFQWLADPDGDPLTLDDVPDVVNNSWGVSEEFAGYFDCDSRWWGAIDACEAAGVVVVFVAGNDGPDPQSVRSPGDRATTLHNCFSVGSTSTESPFGISIFSSRGPSGPNCGPVENRIKPEIVAPGADVYSAIPGGEYGYLSGTSMAAPHVAGVVALMRSANPELDVITIKQVLMETALDRGDPGEDNTYGHGFVDAYAAVLAVVSGYGYLDGTVVDAATGLPLEDAQVAVVGGYQSAVTDAAGAFHLSIPQGEVDLVVTCFGYVENQFTVAIVEGQTLVESFELDLAPIVSLSGRVFDPDGLPAAEAVVEALGVPAEPVTADADGFYELPLPVGASYDVQAELALVGRVIETVELPDSVTLDLYLLPLGAHADLSPQQFAEVLELGEQSTQSLIVANLGADPLFWQLAAEEAKSAPRQTPADLGIADSAPPEPLSDVGQSLVTGYGGPDYFGYIWVDSNEPGGPTFDWVDISGAGETIGNSNNVSYGPFEIGFPFPYYGDTYTQLRICDNGFVTFDSSTEAPGLDQPLPSSVLPDLMVAPFWDDLDPSAGGEIYRYHDAANARYIVQWDNVPHYFTGGNFTFQVILNANGVIEFYYETISYSFDATVGIENAGATDGLTAYHATQYVNDGLAIRFSVNSMVPWLEFQPTSGTVGAGLSAEVPLVFDATDLALGDHAANLTFRSNDADVPVVVMPVALTVVDNTTSAGETPLSFELGNPAPNPFNPATTLRFNLQASGHATLKLYDVHGRLVRTLVDGHHAAGEHEVRWQGRDNTGRSVASGIYCARLVAGGEVSMRRLVLVR